MNKVMLVGRLAQDPELRTTGTGKSVCSFSVAVDRRFKQEGQPTADFFNVVAWGRQAEVISQYLGKGRQIALSGRLQTRSYEARDGSGKRYVTEVVLEEFDFIGGRNDNNGSGYGNGGNTQGYNSNQGYGGNSAPAQPTNNMPLDVDDDFHLLADDEDVPF